jgi:DNA-binding NtrC family response regulator
LKGNAKIGGNQGGVMAEKVRIAVIDDEPSVLESFDMILKIKDYEVDTFLNGASASASFQKGKYAVAFVDMIIPMEEGKFDKQGGLEILNKIKQIDPDTEVIIVTAYGSDQNKSDAIKLGAMDYLRKPFLMEEIYEMVDRGLRRRHSKERGTEVK